MFGAFQNTRIKLVLLGFTVIRWPSPPRRLSAAARTRLRFDTDHDHAVDEHTEHGETVEDHDADEHAGHDHSGAGSTGGHFMALGDNEYQAELLHDEKSGRVTIHLLDAAAKQPVAISEPTITLRLFLDGQFVGFDLKAVPRRVECQERFAVRVGGRRALENPGRQAAGPRTPASDHRRQASTPANVEHEAHEHE